LGKKALLLAHIMNYMEVIMKVHSIVTVLTGINLVKYLGLTLIN